MKLRKVVFLLELNFKHMPYDLSPQFQWINAIDVLPKMVAAGLQYLGVQEIKGVANNPVIMDMARSIGCASIYTSDDKQAWCAVFINHLIRITGKPINLYPKDKYDLLRAKKAASLFPIVPTEQWRFGDVVIIRRDEGGHVFLAIADTAEDTIFGLGGNQSNRVCIAEFEKSRIIHVKRFYHTAIPASAKQYRVNSTGSLSVNEL